MLKWERLFSVFSYLACNEPSFQLVLSTAHRWPDDEMSLHSFQALSVKWINKRMSDTYKLVWLSSRNTKLNKLLPSLIYWEDLLIFRIAKRRIYYCKIIFLNYFYILKWNTRYSYFSSPRVFLKLSPKLIEKFIYAN